MDRTWEEVQNERRQKRKKMVEERPSRRAEEIFARKPYFTGSGQQAGGEKESGNE